MESVGIFLEKLQLGQYIAPFEDTGYQFLKQMQGLSDIGFKLMFDEIERTLKAGNYIVGKHFEVDDRNIIKLWIQGQQSTTTIATTTTTTATSATTSAATPAITMMSKKTPVMGIADNNKRKTPSQNKIENGCSNGHASKKVCMPMNSLRSMWDKVDTDNYGKWIKLDVGGRIFKTSLATLQNSPGSMLATMFSSNGFRNEPDDDGAYFIDRDGTHFRHILNYLRGVLDPTTLSNTVLWELSAEAQFYQIDGLLELLKPKHKNFPFKSVGDRAGVLYWLATDKGTRAQWHDPIGEHVVVTSSHGFANGNEFGPIYFLDPNSYQCGGKCDSGRYHRINVQLLKYLVCPTHYTLSFPRNGNCGRRPYLKWKLEGALDEGQWILLKEHKNSGLRLEDDRAWPVNPTKRFFRYFRLTYTSTKSNFSHEDCHCFHVCGFDVYGTLRDAFPAPIM